MMIRPARPQDACILAELGAATFVETFGHMYSAADLAAHLQHVHSPGRHREVLEDPDNSVWLALDDTGFAVGYAVAGRCKLPVSDTELDAGELKQLYVRASHQQHRVGSKLLREALEWLKERYEPLYVGVWSENIGAQRLYERNGFEHVAEYTFQVGDHRDRDFIFRRSG